MARKWSEIRAEHVAGDEVAELRAATFILERILEDAQIGRAAAERALADERAKSAELTAKVARVEALQSKWRDYGDVGADACADDLAAALAGPEPEAGA